MTEDCLLRAEQMRDLPRGEREEAIDNVVGYGRFTQRGRQVSLRDSYRSPVKPKGDGAA